MRFVNLFFNYGLAILVVLFVYAITFICLCFIALFNWPRAYRELKEFNQFWDDVFNVNA